MQLGVTLFIKEEQSSGSPKDSSEAPSSVQKQRLNMLPSDWSIGWIVE